MNYFVTGASGFIGKRLVTRLLSRPGSIVYFLTRSLELSRLQDLYEYWGCDDKRVVAIVGDLTQADLGVSKTDIPVSYTHLDVYKRQGFLSISSPPLS